MHPAVTSKEEILAVSRDLICTRGWAAVNIRAVAASCGISVGAVYNYFQSKEELMEELVESVWRDIFACTEKEEVFSQIETCLTWLFQRMEYGADRYPGFFTSHSSNFLMGQKEAGRRRMGDTWRHMIEGLCEVLQKDPAISQDAFDQSFTREDFAGILFSLMLSALLRGVYDPRPAIELARRVLYERGWAESGTQNNRKEQKNAGNCGDWV